MTTIDNASQPSIEELRRVVRQLQKRANATRIVAAIVLVVLAVSASQDFHVFMVSGICLVIALAILAVGIPTQIRLFRTRRQLAELLRWGADPVP